MSAHAPAIEAELKGRRVLVVGLGVSGLWTVRWLVRCGARVSVTDLRSESEMPKAVTAEMRRLKVRLETGGHDAKGFLASDGIVVSPGVPLDLPPLRQAAAQGIPVLGELELGSRAVQAPIVAVTGTNGKSTVTTLIGRFLEQGGFRVFLGGNLGTPLIACAMAESQVDVAVIEVSSFQLDTIQTFHPRIAVILNITPDHLDRYVDMDAYAASKFRIFENQENSDYLILNDDDPRLHNVTRATGPRILRYTSDPRETADAFIQDGTVACPSAPAGPSRISLEAFALPGRHNRENLMAATLAALFMGVKCPDLEQAATGFQGLPNRLERVATVNGVQYVNDSKATNVDAAAKALAGFDSPIIWIAGGRHKGASYRPLVRASRQQVRKAVFLGESKHRLAEAVDGQWPVSLADSMEAAVRMATAAAEPGDVVLLAPACSSFDMYANYEERGEAFRKAVKGLGHG